MGTRWVRSKAYPCASPPPAPGCRARRVGAARHEIVRAEPHAPFHGHELVALEVIPLRLDQARLVITLQHSWRALVISDRLIHRCRPIRSEERRVGESWRTRRG